MTILDAIIILFLLSGAVLGFKKGAIKSLVTLLGTIIVVVVAYYLKNPVANIIFDYVPFLNFAGSWEGLSTLNILLYEAIAYVIVFVVLWTVLSLIIKLSGIIEKILNATIILGIPSKIIGAVLGFVEALVFGFLILFVLLQFNVTSEYVHESTLATSIIDKTPIIGTMVNNTYQAVKNIYGLKEKYQNYPNKDAYNCEILSIMLDYEVVTPEVAEKLIAQNKLNFTGAKSIVNSFKEEIKND